MLRSALTVIAFVGAAAIAAHAQAWSCSTSAQSTISTDRPQITSSSIVVPCGSLQLENGFQQTSNDGHETYDLPETAVRFGIAAKTELRFTVPNYFQNAVASDGIVSGWGDLSVGFKEQLGPTKGGFDISLIPSVSFPTGTNSISSRGYDPTVQLPWSHSLTKNWAIAGMFSLMWPTQGSQTGGTQRNLTGQASVFFDRQLTTRWDAFVNIPAGFRSAEARKTSLISVLPTSFPPTSSLIFMRDSGCRLRCPITRSALAIRSASRRFVPGK